MVDADDGSIAVSRGNSCNSYYFEHSAPSANNLSAPRKCCGESEMLAFPTMGKNDELEDRHIVFLE